MILNLERLTWLRRIQLKKLTRLKTRWHVIKQPPYFRLQLVETLHPSLIGHTYRTYYISATLSTRFWPDFEDFCQSEYEY